MSELSTAGCVDFQRLIVGLCMSDRLDLAKAAGSIATGIVGLLPAFALHHCAGTDIATGLLFTCAAA